ncbi:biotin/lipoate a/B protein ligase family domain-containing protein [Ditylenchus destructor]|nr:biotin/lipoate a/B protein ligase family domain-containing protein [Ditylenchus destructor]
MGSVKEKQETDESVAKFCEIPNLTCGYLIGERNDLVAIIKELRTDVATGLSPELIFSEGFHDNSDKSATSTHLPVYIIGRDEVRDAFEGFKPDNYFKCLSTKRWGRMLLYVNVCETTVNISRSISAVLPQTEGIIVVAQYQTKGRGRSEVQKWISPKGCAVFNFNFKVPTNSELGQSIIFVEHILAVAIVDAIQALLHDEEFPVRVKWPNDVYYERNIKIAGVLIDVISKDDYLDCITAAGINVANSKPVGCLNDILPEEKQLNIDEVIAEVMNKFEYYVDLIKTEGKAKFFGIYYKRWLHTDENVTVMTHDNKQPEEAIVRGINDNGDLILESKIDGRNFTVQDDFNSFDINNHIIHPKV